MLKYFSPTEKKENDIAASDEAMPKVRPLRCSGCFHSNFPIMVDQADLCHTKGDTRIDIIFLIMSAPGHILQRNAIRKTWASRTKHNTANLRHVFLLGRAGESNLDHANEREAGEFHDVVISGFRDSYRNLTLKVIAGLRWMTTGCPKARAFVKVDDDMWFNPGVLVAQRTKHARFLQHGLMGVSCHDRAPVIRSKESKWYVPEEMFPARHYPPYCIGALYLGSVNTARKVVGMSALVPYFFLEDVFVGLCLQGTGFRVKGFRAVGLSLLGSPRCRRHPPHVFVHGVTPRDLLTLWRNGCL
ncbi:hypothetical protein ACOMHN_015456 [Nucella lapillus]